MTLATKIVLTIVVCFTLFVVGVIGLGTYFWSRHGRELIEAGSRNYDAGLAFGRQTDEAGCLNEAVAHYKASGGMTGSVSAGVFARACWRSSRPTPGFCDQVPKPLDFIRAARWQSDHARGAGVDEQFGGQIFAQQQAYCDARPPAKASTTGP